MAKRLAALAFLVTIFVAAGDDLSLGQTPPIAGEYVPGEVLVIERPGAQARSLAAAVPGAEEVQRLPSLGLRRLKLPPQVSVEEAVRSYSALHWVDAAEPNYVIRAAVTPNDTFYGSQQWYYDLLEGPAAWDIETGDESIAVAVIDTGIDLLHPDIDDNLWVNGADPIDGVDNDGNTIVDDRSGAAFISAPSSGCTSPAANDPDDDNGHGTFVAGIVGAETNNNAGVAGTAWEVMLMAVKALDCAGSGTAFDAASAIDYAATQGADIVNMSFSQCVRNPCVTGQCEQPVASSTLETAIQQAQATYGTIFVAAASNDNCPYVGYPAAFPEVIAVAASGGSASPDSRAGFSNWGPEIDVAAPGQEICSTALPSTYTCFLSGTSMAAPLVSGLAALILSRDSILTFDDVRDIITGTATDLPDGSAPNWDGAGRINMRLALEALNFRGFLPGISRS